MFELAGKLELVATSGDASVLAALEHARARPQRQRLAPHRRALARIDAGGDLHQRGPPELGHADAAAAVQLPQPAQVQALLGLASVETAARYSRAGKDEQAAIDRIFE